MSETNKTNGPSVAARHILAKVKDGTLTADEAKLAKYIETECGVYYLVAACQAALALDAVGGEVETQLRGALAWAGYRDE